MEEEDAVFPDVEQAIRDRIDDEMVNHALMERVMADEQPAPILPIITKRHTS
jgi:hypothetical protein